MPKERTKPLAQQVLERKSEPISIKEPPVKRFLSTGCSVLNCILSDRVDGGWPSGRLSNLIGDSDTAKTVLGLHALAEACRNPAFDTYDLIYNDIEGALTPDTLNMFGKKFQARTKFLIPGDEDNQPPSTIEEWHWRLLDRFEDGNPFIEILDSFDFLPSQADLDKSQEQKKAFMAGKESKGTYQMSKQKHFKQMLREIKGMICQTDSIIIIISQTIDNIGSMFDPKTVAGGNALEFASRIRFWLSKLETDKVNKRIIGRKVRSKCSKNHITGKLREAPLWVYSGLGVDDIRTSVDFLVTEGAWSKVGGWIAPDGITDQKMQVKDLIKYIETNKLQRVLNKLVQKKWNAIEDSLKLDREARYE